MSCMFVVYIFVMMKFTITGPTSNSNEQSEYIYTKSQATTTQMKSLQNHHTVSKTPPLRGIPEVGQFRVGPANRSRGSSPFSLKTQNNSVEQNIAYPDDTVTSVVQCSTSRGNLTIDVRGGWAPRGSLRFLELINKGLFTNLPFFRVCPRYITQFGVRYGFHERFSNLPDDPSLWGQRDMDFGYVFFAVSVHKTRSD